MFEPTIEDTPLTIKLYAPEDWWLESDYVEEFNHSSTENGSDAMLAWYPDSYKASAIPNLGDVSILLRNPPSNPSKALQLLVEIKGKLVGRSFPNNIDVADFRTLEQNCTQFLGFYNLSEMLSHLRNCKETLIGGVILLDSVTIEEYQQVSKDIADCFPRGC